VNEYPTTPPRHEGEDSTNYMLRSLMHAAWNEGRAATTDENPYTDAR
jgi:hypothetical protein